MKLKDLKELGYNYNLDVNVGRDQVVVREVEDVTIETRTKNCTVILTINDPNNVVSGMGESQSSMIVCKVMATGSGKTMRAAEKSAIKECLKRVELKGITDKQFNHDIKLKPLDDTELPNDKVVKNVLVTLIAFNPSKIVKGVEGNSPELCRTVKATGSGATMRAAERDGIKECPKRINL
jgi:hypothetical protein